MIEMRDLTAGESDVLAEIFSAFRAQDIPFLLLRNYKGLPARIGNDCDVFVNECDRFRALEIVEDRAGKAGLRVLSRFSLGYFDAIWLAGDQPLPLHIDVYPGAFTWKGFRYLEDSEVFAASHLWNGYPVPSAFHEALSLIATSLLWGGFYKKRYQDDLMMLLPDTETRTAFGKYFSELFSISLPPWIWNDEDPSRETLLAFVRSLRRGAMRRSWKVSPARTVGEVFRHWMAEFRALRKPSGLCVAVIGPDGAGKSTLIESLTQSLKPFFGEIETFHWRPGLLNDFGVLFLRRKKSTQGKAVSDPHAKPSHGRIISAVRLIYYLTDFVVGMLTVVQRRKSKNRLIVFDRFYCDMWLDPRRFRLTLPKSLVRFIGRFVPNPDLYILLGGDAASIHARKPETTIDAVAEFTAGYETLTAANSVRTCSLDATRPAKEIAESARAAILGLLAGRQ